MTESMVERVENALFAVVENLGPETHLYPRVARLMARAAIAAMREPTFDVQVGCLEGGAAYSKEIAERIKETAEGNEAIAILVACGDGRLYKAAWQGGIDAALSEEKEPAR